MYWWFLLMFALSFPFGGSMYWWFLLVFAVGFVVGAACTWVYANKVFMDNLK